VKGQIAQTSREPIEYTWLGNGPVVLACRGTSQDCYSTQGLESMVRAGFSLLTPSQQLRYGQTPLEAGKTLVALLGCLRKALEFQERRA
jgi:hypothetical protein